MMKNWNRFVLIVPVFLFLFFMGTRAGYCGKDQVELRATMVVASNEGNDFNIVNDTYRDEILKLFSYSSYNQEKELVVKLVKGDRQRLELPGGYELILTLQDLDKGRVYVQAVIRKDNLQYLDTVLSILKPGVVFVGGPVVPEKGELIIILETGF